MSASSSGLRSAYLLLGATILVGSVSFTLVQLALDELSPMVLAFGRVAVSALMYTAIVAAQPQRRTPLRAGERWRVFFCGFGGSALFHLLFNWGQNRLPVAIAAVIMATYPVMTTIGEVVFLGHRLRAVQVVGVVLATLGCIVVALDGGVGGDEVTLWPMLAVLVAALTWAVVTIVTRDIGGRYDSWWINTPGTVAGAVFMLGVAAPDLGELGELSPRGWLVMIWLGSASSAFIYFAYARIMRVLSATTTTSISTAVTPLSIVVAWAVLSEPPTIVQVVGGLVVVAGVLLAVTAGRRADVGLLVDGEDQQAVTSPA